MKTYGGGSNKIDTVSNSLHKAFHSSLEYQGELKICSYYVGWGLSTLQGGEDELPVIGSSQDSLHSQLAQDLIHRERRNLEQVVIFADESTYRKCGEQEETAERLWFGVQGQRWCSLREHGWLYPKVNTTSGFWILQHCRSSLGFCGWSAFVNDRPRNRMQKIIFNKICW